MDTNFIIILGAIVCLSFLIFIVITIKEFMKMSKNEFKEERNQSAEKFLNIISKPYDNKSGSTKK